MAKVRVEAHVIDHLRGHQGQVIDRSCAWSPSCVFRTIAPTDYDA
jgi:hypothetical protein